MSDIQANETLIGIDYGDKNIGIAFGKNGLTQPLKITSAKNIHSAMHEIIKIALEAGATKFIIGLPLDAEGKETHQSKEIRKFGKTLKITSKKPVEYFDENLSSKEALKEAISQGIPKGKRVANDHIAAAVILKRYYQQKGVDSQEGFLYTSHREIS